MLRAWVVGLLLMASLSARSLAAQNLAGTWQGTIPLFGQSFREVVHMAKAGRGWAATVYSIDEQSDSARSASVALNGSRVVITFPGALTFPDGATYDGQLDSSAHTITGTWIEPAGHFPLVMRRVSGNDVWPLPRGHASRFVAVDTNVKLEVLDWGGTGPPIVFLAGLGGTAHAFDIFAPKFAARYHVYGITRRGFGQSSAPVPTDDNYSATRLGDDIIAVLDSLHLAKPVLIGHSIAGEELSSIGSRRPDRAAGLVYLDAGYAYAYYDTATGSALLDRTDLIAKLRRVDGRISLRDRRALMRELLTDMPRYERDLRLMLDASASAPDSLSVPPEFPRRAIGMAIQQGGEKFTHIPVPVLAIFALPHDPAPPGDSAIVATQVNAFAAGVPTARIVRLPHAKHSVWMSNEADVLREVNAFLEQVSRRVSGCTSRASSRLPGRRCDAARRAPGSVASLGT